jgi:hypothetical protein
MQALVREGGGGGEARGKATVYSFQPRHSNLAEIHGRMAARHPEKQPRAGHPFRWRRREFVGGSRAGFAVESRSSESLAGSRESVRGGGTSNRRLFVGHGSESRDLRAAKPTPAHTTPLKRCVLTSQSRDPDPET